VRGMAGQSLLHDRSNCPNIITRLEPRKARALESYFLRGCIGFVSICFTVFAVKCVFANYTSNLNAAMCVMKNAQDIVHDDMSLLAFRSICKVSICKVSMFLTDRSRTHSRSGNNNVLSGTTFPYHLLQKVKGEYRK
jgi:hypothetical protein